MRQTPPGWITANVQLTSINVSSNQNAPFPQAHEAANPCTDSAALLPPQISLRRAHRFDITIYSFTTHAALHKRTRLPCPKPSTFSPLRVIPNITSIAIISEKYKQTIYRLQKPFHTHANTSRYPPLHVNLSFRKFYLHSVASPLPPPAHPRHFQLPRRYPRPRPAHSQRPI